MNFQTLKPGAIYRAVWPGLLYDTVSQGIFLCSIPENSLVIFLKKCEITGMMKVIYCDKIRWMIQNLLEEVK